MKLCAICSAANGRKEHTPLGCELCQGKALSTDLMIEEAVSLLGKEDASSFSISTLIPKEWLVREERAWDEKSHDGVQSIKNHLNRYIASKMSKATNLPYIGDGDCRLIFDFQSTPPKIFIQRNDLFIFGRYKKLVAGLSQSRWRCNDCGGAGCSKCGGSGKNFESVEERIGEPFKFASGSIDYVMHASGREDVDATNTAGRGFVLELKEPKMRRLVLGAIADNIAAGREVEVIGLRVVPRTFCELVTESHFDKTYEAEISFGEAVSGDRLRAVLSSILGKTISQRTPTRVAHRRADLVRYRKVKQLELVSEADGGVAKTAAAKVVAKIRVRAEAGTYIKELISGDSGRTEPSVCGLLGTPTTCTKLVVTAIDDGYLDFCVLGQG